MSKCKKILPVLIVCATMILNSCAKDDIKYVGQVEITVNSKTDFGIFDFSLYDEPFFFKEDAIEYIENGQGTYEFKLNPGNYICGKIYTDRYVTFQVRIGETTYVDF